MIRYGTWGGGLFQSIYEPAPGTLSNFLMTPESLLVLVPLAVVSALGALWPPLLAALPAFVVGSATVVGRAVTASWHANRAVPGRSPRPSCSDVAR